MQFCQIVMACVLVVGLFHGLRQDFYGRTAREPYGFGGAVTTIVITALMAFIYYKAGAFSTFFPQ